MRFCWSAICLLPLLGSPLAAGVIDATYVVGNLKELSAGDAVILRVDNGELSVRSGKITVAVDYKKITGYEMGPALVRPSNARVWKRLTSKRPAYRNLTVDFAGASGEEHVMTLELPEVVAAEVYDAIETGTGTRRANSTSQPWWGDNMWRTTRNNGEWNGATPPPAKAAPRSGN